MCTSKTLSLEVTLAQAHTGVGSHQDNSTVLIECKACGFNTKVTIYKD